MPNFKDLACPKSIAKESRLTARKKTIFDAAASIGKLEFLNDFGVAGDVRKALETVAILSDTIRVGDTTTNTEAGGGILAEDGGGLMSALNLGGAIQDAVAAFDPNAVNGAVGASRAIVARARQGNFRIEDIPTAAGEFKNIIQIAGRIFKPPIDGDPSSDFQKFQCRPSPYASDLVHKAPKQNFQFVVEIALNPAYLETFVLPQETIRDPDLSENEITQFGTDRGVFDTINDAVRRERARQIQSNIRTPTAQIPAQLSFLIKNTGRPSVTYEYEDLNYYNYRTKGIRKATFNPITMNFIDDQLNTASAFYAFYLSAMSPITNTAHSRKENSLDRHNHEQNGMSFPNFESRATNGSENESNTFPAYSSTVGALKPSSQADANRTRRIIDRISIYQYGSNGNTFSAYNMFAPRIMTFNPSEATMADSGEGQTLAMDIDYDYFTIQPELPIGGDEIDAETAADLSGGSAGAFYPNRYFGPNDVRPREDVTPGGNLSSSVGSLFGL